VEGKLQWSDLPFFSSSPSFPGCAIGHDLAVDSVQSNHGGTVLPIIDHCGMSLVLDQVSSTRACQQVPSFTCCTWLLVATFWQGSLLV